MLRDAKTSRAPRSCTPDRTHGRLVERSQPPLSRWRRDPANSWTAHRSSYRPRRRLCRASESPVDSTSSVGNERILRADGIGRSPRAARWRTAPRCVGAVRCVRSGGQNRPFRPLPPSPRSSSTAARCCWRSSGRPRAVRAAAAGARRVARALLRAGDAADDVRRRRVLELRRLLRFRRVLRRVVPSVAIGQLKPS